MKKRYIIAGLITTAYTQFAEAQMTSKTSFEKAEDAYEEFAFMEAAELYKESLSRTYDSVYVVKQIARCHKQLNQPDSIEHYLSMIIEEPELEPACYFQYAEALSSNAKYDEAFKWYQKYQDKVSNDEVAATKMQALSNIKDFYSDSSYYSVEKMSFNSDGYDFSPAIYKEGLVFISSRNPKGFANSKRSIWDNSRYLNIFYYNPNDTSDINFFSKGLGSKFHEGPVDFYNNENNIAFTRTSMKPSKLRDQIVRLGIYFADHKEKSDTWGKPIPFEYNSTKHSVGHPTLSEDGTTMIFTSDMEGTKGQTDLFISFKEESGWSKPKNLGDQVNTKGKELFPTLIGKRLFFASNGRGGLGGLDIFSVDLSEEFETLADATNVGYPINSNRDDFGIATNEDFTEGYFSSTRVGSQLDDLYRFTFAVTDTQGVVRDLVSNEPLKGVDILLYNKKSKMQVYRRTNQNGEFSFPFIKNSTWIIRSAKYHYEVKKFEIENIAKDQIVTIELERKE